MMNRATILLVALVVQSMAVNVVADSLSVNDDSTQYLLDQHLEVYFDAEGKKTFDEIKSLGKENWRNVDKTQFGFKKQTLWLRITIDVSQSTKRWSVTESTTTFDHFRVYVPDNDRYSVKDYGLLSGNKRPSGYRVIKIAIEKSPKPITLYFSISSSTPLIPAFKLVNEEGFAKNNMLENYSLGAYYGMAMVVFILHLCIGLILRDANSIIFCVYILSFAVLGFYLQGIHYQLFSTGLTANDLGFNFQNPATTFNWVLLAATLSFLMLAQRLLKKKENKFERRLFGVFYVVSLAIMLPQLFIKSEGLMFLYSIFKMTTLIIILCYAFYKGVKEQDESVLYFALGLMFPATGLVIYSAVVSGVIEANLFTMYAGHYMSIGEFAFISLSMASRLRKVNREHQKALSRNVVELTEAKNEADKANAAKDVFLATVSHELKTPLNVISGTLQIIEETPLKGMQSSMVSLCAEQSLFLEKLVNDILDMSSIERGKFSFVSAACNPFEVIEKVVGGYRTEAERKGLELSYIQSNSALQTACVVNTDAFRFSQLAVNLVSNAIKFTNHGYVQVVLHSATTGESDRLRFVLQVKDTGNGIAKDHQEAIFHEFNTLSNDANERVYGGIGLGLAIVKNIAELFNGEISVDSQVGIGSNFKFEFVAERGSLSQTDDKKTIDSEKLLITSSEHTIDILLVEDNASNQVVFEKILAIKDIPLESASSVDEAIEILKTRTFDLIFMDIAMPERSGYELAEHIRGARNDFDTHLVAVTADTRMSTKKKCKASGINDFIEKPIKQYILYQKINDLMKAKQYAKDMVAEYHREWIEQ